MSASKRKRVRLPVAGAGRVACVTSGATAGPAASVPEVGRLVDSSQADDRRMIRLVQERPLLYARNNMAVASYYTQVKKLWQEVADEMGWSVADVRRKWSHVRNSYSRHLRNEMYGVRTGRGRIVSKWYLADELDFLRDHMATDTRPSRYSYPSLYLDIKSPPKHSQASDSVDYEPFLKNPWFTALTGQAQLESAPEPAVHLDETNSRGSFEPDENTAYFQFFRGIYNDYQELPATKQRLFRRECLNMLHQLLDDEDRNNKNEVQEEQHDAVNLSNSAVDSDDERDNKNFLLDKSATEVSHSILPI